MARIRQKFPHDNLSDIQNIIRTKLVEAGIGDKIHPGNRIGITGSSRGMGGFLSMLKGIVTVIKEFGGKPFIIPAMGSHGGAFAGGQIDILTRLGVTEEAIGAPIRATMDTITLGVAENGAKAHLDAIAAEADGIIVFERVKIHPESVGDYGSGMLKCVTIGVGKQHGAQEAHSHGLWESVRAVPKITMSPQV